MNAEKLSRAMQYVNDDLLMEYLQTDDKLTAKKSAARYRALKRLAAAACIVLLVVIAGAAAYKRREKEPEEGIAVNDTEIDPASVQILLNGEKYQMFRDPQSVQEVKTDHGLPAGYSEDRIGEKLGYLEMTANTTDGSLCFAFTEEKTQFVLYACGNTDGDDCYILQSEDGCYLLIKDGIVN